MPRTVPTRSIDGRYRLTVRVEHRVDRETLIGALMAILADRDDPEAYARGPVHDVREDVKELLRARGAYLDATAITDIHADEYPGLRAQAEALAVRAYPPFPLDEPRPERGRMVAVRPDGRTGVRLEPVDGTGGTSTSV